MPDRHGYKVDGGWASGGDQVNGNTVPQTLTVDARNTNNTPNEYKASQQIEFTDGFVSGVNDDFVAYIADGSNTTAGNPNGSGGQYNSYRYGFNGKENDDEVKGEGNQVNFGMRVYDPRIGRFLSLDPAMTKYADMTPYHFALNRPISHVDIEGKYALFLHFMLTRYMLMQAGVSEVQANLIAHYASVYADNPGGIKKFSDYKSYSKADIIISINLKESQKDNPIFSKIGGKVSENVMLYGVTYNTDKDYSRTSKSQSEDAEAQLWHATRTHSERDAVTAQDAVNRSFTNAWALIFKSAGSGKIEDMKSNSVAVQDLGIALHTFQDIEAHRGAVFRATVLNGGGAFSTNGNQHDLDNDTHPDAARFGIAQFFTGNAIIVHQIMSGNVTRLNDGLQISTQGMSQDQIQQLSSKINAAGYNFTSNGSNTYMYSVKKK